MAQKDIIGLILAAGGILGGIIAATISKRLRDVFFTAMIVLAPMTEDWDVNFVSRDFYRGTTRGFEFSLVDILSISLLASAILAPRKEQSRGFWPASFGLMLLFFCYACFNVAMADPKLFGLFELSKMLRGLTIFLAVAFFVRTERELKLFVFALGVIVSYEGLVALQQRYYYGINRVPGTVDDSNSLSVFFCTTAPIFVAAINAKLPKFLKGLGAIAIALSCVGVILTISRAGVVILGLILLGAALTTMSWRLTPKKIICTILVIAGVAGMLGKSWKTLQSRFNETNLEAEYGNKKNLGRGYYIRVAVAIAEDQTFGVGLNNWSYWVSQKYGPKLGYRFVKYRGTDTEPSTVIPPGSNVDEAQAAPAHSLGALTAGELGIQGLVLFAFLWMRWFQMALSFLWPRTPEPMRRMGVGILFGLSGLFLQSLTEWVFRHSPIYYTAHILLGVLASPYWLKRREKRQQKAVAEAAYQENFAPVGTVPHLSGVSTG
ncbi:MAG TPA: O-antigen ligase family protein [Candidatus Eisenbacteria bacterium]|nr:O-antigen ligase family protein [Candidatus Eisenbacteria bacterium]